MLKDNVAEYYQLKQETKTLEGKIDKLNSDIKTDMKNQNITEFKEGGYTATFTVQKRNSLLNDVLLAKLKSLNLTKAIKTIETPNEQVIEDMIYNGELDPSILQECTTVKEVEVLKITYKKEKGGK